MNNRARIIILIIGLIILGSFGAFVGAVVAFVGNPLPLLNRERLVPALYRIPKIPGGTPLRLAMVHDVLHERYLRHGKAWYAQRNIDAGKIIAAHLPAPHAEPSGSYLDAMDDLAIGYERLGNYDQGIGVMREKLKLLPALPPSPATRPIDNIGDEYRRDETDLQQIIAAQDLPPVQHHQYTACANLGTILAHGAMAKAMTGDAGARAQVREGLEFIRRAVAINPGAHFGREKWQAVAIEHLLAAMDHPEILQEYNLIGEDITKPVRVSDWRRPRGALMPADGSDADLPSELRVRIRSGIQRIGMDDPTWATGVHPDLYRLAPFDEPTLGIIGMWTLGGGANPHFALALGNIMEDIGQRSIAWNAYERAVELQDHFWPAADARTAMVEYCRKRQTALAHEESSDDPKGWTEKMRKTHQRELAWGIAYQQAYQDFEASQIKAGVRLDNPDFYTPFFNGRPPIATPPGLADDMILTIQQAQSLADSLPCMLLGAAIAMVLGLVTNWIRKFRLV